MQVLFGGGYLTSHLVFQFSKKGRDGDFFTIFKLLLIHTKYCMQVSFVDGCLLFQFSKREGEGLFFYYFKVVDRFIWFILLDFLYVQTFSESPTDIYGNSVQLTFLSYHALTFFLNVLDLWDQ